LKIQDGGGRHVENYKNCDISATVFPIFTKFGTLMQNGPLNHSDRLKSLNFTTPRWRSAAILKTVKSPYLCNKAYLSAITMTHSQSFYLQDGGKKQLAQIWNKITSLSLYLMRPLLHI